jgi:flagellar hook-associated protein 1 FlgK
MAISVGLNTAMRALLTQQAAMDVTSHNVANLNTIGFTRQRAHLESVSPVGLPPVGGGVDMQSVERVRDQFLDLQMRMEAGAAGSFKMQADSLALAELALGEPGDGGIRQLLSTFFNAWRDLANAPEESAARQAVLQTGSSLTLAMRRINTTFNSLRDDANDRVALLVDEMNTLADNVAGLNQQIMALRATGDAASDLTDRRDLALDRLAEIADVQYLERDTGVVDVYIAGRSLVSGSTANTMYVDPDIANNNYFDVKWTSDNTLAQFSSGEIQGLLIQRDTDLPGRIADFNTLTSQIINDVNAAHAAGFALDGVTTATPFFAGTDASDIAIDPIVLADPTLLAAAQLPTAPGDASNAHAIADLQFALNLAGGTQSYEEFYGGMVTTLGTDARDTAAVAESQDLLISRIDSFRQSVSGVNLDEEMVQMVQYQRAYEAASQIIRKIDEMLDQLINRTI